MLGSFKCEVVVVIIPEKALVQCICLLLRLILHTLELELGGVYILREVLVEHVLVSHYVLVVF